MDAQLALRLLGRVMNWDDVEATREFRWLQLMGNMKYDGYEDYRAGVRFLESLARWLQQFSKPDRPAAYEFVRRRLVYISPAELQRLIELFYPRSLEPLLIDIVSSRRSIPSYEVWLDKAARESLEALKRKTLIMALSDGARLDQLRRATGGILNNEQFIGMTEVNEGKWKSALEKLRSVEGSDARFEVVCLVDDFMGTGTSFLRKDGTEWTGKMIRFRKSLKSANPTEFLHEGWILHVHHYLRGPDASNVTSRVQEAHTEHGDDWFNEVRMTFGMLLQETLKVSPERDPEFSRIAKNHYNSSIQTIHTDKGGVKRIDFGYGGCALPLVLEHNTPNNSMALLWAECKEAASDPKQPEMRPLFYRRERHTR